MSVSAGVTTRMANAIWSEGRLESRYLIGISNQRRCDTVWYRGSESTVILYTARLCGFYRRTSGSAEEISSPSERATLQRSSHND